VSHADDSQTLNISDLSIISNGVFKLPGAPPPKKKQKVTNNVKKTNKNFICTYCLKAYASDNSMKKHMRVHTMQG